MGSLLSIFRPEFTWPRPMQASISRTTPAVPRSPGRLRLRIFGVVHAALGSFSMWYSQWYNLYSEGAIFELPFGLILKWSERTSLEEAAAMRMARSAGMPVPRVLSCGEHPHSPFKFSILMTRLPGLSLNNSGDALNVDAEEPWLEELRECVTAMRAWHSPYGEHICSPIGTLIHSTRVPTRAMGPFANESELHDFLLAAASEHGFESITAYEAALSLANNIRTFDHQITFTHGDFKAHNILLGDDGHLSGFLDWESGAWMPEYWEFTTAMRFGGGSWWYQVASWMGGSRYMPQLASDKALNSLTVGSYIGM